MNASSNVVTRRNFLFTSAGVTSAAVLRERPDPVAVVVVGYGSHARRLICGTPPELLRVDAIFDPDGAALDQARKDFRWRQRYTPELLRTARPRFGSADRHSVLLCSPCGTWQSLLPSLKREEQMIYAQHLSAFDSRDSLSYVAGLARDHQQILIGGFDASFPSRQLSAFYDSEGADEIRYELSHRFKSTREILAFHYDCMTTVSADHRSLDFVALPTLGSGGEATRARCAVVAEARGRRAKAYFTVRDEGTGYGDWALVGRLRDFGAAPSRERTGIVQRRSAALEIVRRTMGRTTLFDVEP